MEWRLGGPAFRVRWWNDERGFSCAGVRDENGWTFYEKEYQGIRWYKASSTTELIQEAERLLAAGENVKEVKSGRMPTPDVGNRGETLPESEPKVFICYAKEDAKVAEDIYKRLNRSGFDAWVDKHRLVLGDNWEVELKKAVTEADAFVVCLRPGFDALGFRQKEVRWALEALRSRPPDRAFIVPMVIQPCELPEWCRPFHAGNYLGTATTFSELVRALRKHLK